MEESKSVVTESKGKGCCCQVILGALVIVFAWWNVSWAPVALTVLGVLIIVKEIAKRCCCDKLCKK